MHWYLFPFSILYGTIVRVRNKFFDWGWIESKKYDLPIINVGNISVGGTGKTPHVEYLLSLLTKYKVSTISRGYKRKTKGFIEVKTQSNVRDVGDEPLQIKRKFPETLVIVDEKRVHAIDTIIAMQNTPDVIVLDDAYQHRYVHPGLNILLVDFNRPITKDYMLPVGRLRESSHNSHRADVVIVTKCPEDISSMDMRIMQKELNLFAYQHLFFSMFVYDSMRSIFGNENRYKDISDLSGISILVVTGIANPKPLYKKLENVGATVYPLSFSDHHNFAISDINKIEKQFCAIESKEKIIVCTEKDAIRLKTKEFKSPLSKLPFYFLPIKVSLLSKKDLAFEMMINKFIDSF